MEGIPPGRPLTKKEVAAALGVSEKTLARLVSTHRLSKPKRQGKQHRWFEADVQIYLYRQARGDFDDLPPLEEEDEEG